MADKDRMTVTVAYIYPYSVTGDPQAKQEDESFCVPVATFERIMGELSQESEAPSHPFKYACPGGTLCAVCGTDHRSPPSDDDSDGWCNCDVQDMGGGEHDDTCAIYVQRPVTP